MKHGTDDEDESKPGSSRPTKKVKTEGKSTEKSLDMMSVADLKKLVVKGTLGAFTVQQLKDFLLTKGGRATGKKADLVEKVEQWVENN